MNGERSRGSLLDLAWLLLMIYFFWSVLGRREPAPPRPAAETPWRAFQGEQRQPDWKPLRNPLDPHNQWERLNEEKKRKARGGP